MPEASHDSPAGSTTAEDGASAQYWQPGPMFAGVPVAIVGSGWSLNETDPALLAGVPVIAINAAINWYPKADIWFSVHPEIVAESPPA